MVKILESDNKDYGCYGNLMICFKVDEFYSSLVNNQDFRTEFKKKFTKRKVLKLFNRYVEE